MNSKSLFFWFLRIQFSNDLLGAVYSYKGSKSSMYDSTVFQKSKDREALSVQSTKTTTGADSGSDHELLPAKFRLKLKKVGKSTRPFRNDLKSCMRWKKSTDK
ncbi:craniofacial development protein 2-like [Ovis canadensis]|uniref:craniofacial development protein 2-like n=1 Tax=Ovis canadensis TaxID=37174 RepID=UPI003752CC6D